ncbi:Uncharacterised protein [Yersinia thracica]|uniref:DUF930 domain-containing protein n=1 Tax=Yersinia thracica TaxID=2890319 RepID=A0A0T9NG74_9GAMM|nr:hypothetical protein [Yersinia thracica]CNH06822.1 Uncharacterised protein [Yersinia thracica]
MQLSAKYIIGVLLLFLTPVAPSELQSLTAGIQTKIDVAISQLYRSEDRQIAINWDNAKKVSEFICRPIALTEIQRKGFPKADRIFLGDNNQNSLSLSLIDQYHLTGIGEVRIDNAWYDLTVQCDIDSVKGDVTYFNIILSP